MVFLGFWFNIAVVGQVSGSTAAMLMTIETILLALAVGISTLRYRAFLALSLISGAGLLAFRVMIAGQNLASYGSQLNSGGAAILSLGQFAAFFLAASLVNLIMVSFGDRSETRVVDGRDR